MTSLARVNETVTNLAIIGAPALSADGSAVAFSTSAAGVDAAMPCATRPSQMRASAPTPMYTAMVWFGRTSAFQSSWGAPFFRCPVMNTHDCA